MESSFEDLNVWERSKALAVEVCRLLAGCRDFGFRDQITRSAISVPSNIAEGSERNSRPEYRLFVGYARGSAGELRTQLMIGQELGHIESQSADRMIAESREISRMLFGLLRSLE